MADFANLVETVARAIRPLCTGTVGGTCGEGCACEAEARAAIAAIGEHLRGTAAAFDVIPPGPTTPPLRLTGGVQVRRRGYPPHPEAWGIYNGDECLTRDGRWVIEPLPSRRDDDWYARSRWPNPLLAIAFVHDHLRRYPSGYSPEDLI